MFDIPSKYRSYVNVIQFDTPLCSILYSVHTTYIAHVYPLYLQVSGQRVSHQSAASYTQTVPHPLNHPGRHHPRHHPGEYSPSIPLACHPAGWRKHPLPSYPGPTNINTVIITIETVTVVTATVRCTAHLVAIATRGVPTEAMTVHWTVSMATRARCRLVAMTSPQTVSVVTRYTTWMECVLRMC